MNPSISFENPRCTRVLASKTFTGKTATRDADAWCKAVIANHAELYRQEGAQVTIFGAAESSMVTDGGDEAEARYSFDWEDDTTPTVAELRVRDF
jgi:hypothetical protein